MVSLGESQFPHHKSVAHPALSHSHNVAAFLSPGTVRPHAQDEWHFTPTRDRSYGSVHDLAFMRSVHHLLVVEISSTDGTGRSLYANEHSVARSHRASLSHRPLDAGDTTPHHRTAGG